MKITETQKIIKTVVIDYENGIICKYHTTDGILTSYIFSDSNSTNLKYVKDVDCLLSTPFYEQSNLITNIETISELEKFNMFDNLFYIGGHSDGMLADRNGNFLSIPTRLDDVFCQCFLHIEKKEEKCKKILDSLNQDFLISTNIEEIPSYNWSDDKKHHYTLDLLVKIPNDVYQKILGDKTFFDDICRLEMFNYLKTKKDDQ